MCVCVRACVCVRIQCMSLFVRLSSYLGRYQSSVKPGEAHREQLNAFGFMVNSTFRKDDGMYNDPLYFCFADKHKDCSGLTLQMTTKRSVFSSTPSQRTLLV